MVAKEDDRRWVLIRFYFCVLVFVFCTWVCNLKNIGFYLVWVCFDGEDDRRGGCFVGEMTGWVGVSSKKMIGEGWREDG